VSISRYSLRAGYVVVGTMLAAFSLTSCDLAKNQLTYDRGSNQDIQEYRDGLSPDHHPSSEAAAPLPEFQSVVATPKDLKLPSPLVTVSVNQTVSLHDLMFELADQAGIDLEMDPNIHGSIIFTAKDRPFSDVVDRICAMAGLRYTFDNNVLRVQVDRPFTKEYRMDYTSVGRKSTSTIETGVQSAAGGGGSGGSTTASKQGSDVKVDNANDSDFWKDVDAGLSQLLASSDGTMTLASQSDPVAVAEAPPPVPEGQPPSNLPPSLTVNTAPAAPATTAATPAPKAGYSISKHTGVITVFASERQQKLVQKFLDQYRHQAMTQILLEAKVLEVDLDDQYATGIDWTDLSANLTRLVPSATANFTSPGLPAPGAVGSSASLIANLDLGHGFKPVIQALSQFGTVRSLSSPRVTVMNNQSAVVNVAENLVYFSIQATVSPASTTSAATIAYTTTQQSVPAGVLLNVTPTVNPDTGEIMLAVRPTVSKKIDTVLDPGVPLNIYGNAGASAQADITQITGLDPTVGQVPEMSVQEIDSMVKMQSGQTMIMGGLMKDGNTVTQAGVPILGDIPGIGALFHNHSDEVQKSELVIFLKASIIPGSNVDDTDRKIYKQFGNDSRPFPM
jgi:MSHA biogenesis protein MshL